MERRSGGRRSGLTARRARASSSTTTRVIRRHLMRCPAMPKGWRTRSACPVAGTRDKRDDGARALAAYSERLIETVRSSVAASATSRG